MPMLKIIACMKRVVSSLTLLSYRKQRILSEVSFYEYKKLSGY